MWIADKHVDRADMKNQKTDALALPTTHKGSQGAAARVSILDRRLAEKMIRLVNRPTVALSLWNGEEIRLPGSAPTVRAHIRDRGAFYRLIRNPSLHFGDLYSVGRIDVDGDFVHFLTSTYEGMADQSNPSLLRRLHNWMTPRPRANTLSGSRANIHHHYDLGNSFYELWLDREYQQYTCAYFPEPSLTIEQAQIAKLDHVCRKLELKPGDTVVEAGCGWGGLARYMARTYGVRVRAFNI